MLETKRPSDARRGLLKSQESSLDHIRVSNICNIDSYYSVAEKVLMRFDLRYDQCSSINNIVDDLTEENVSLLDDAYIYGRRYCMFVSQVLPKHDYFKSSQISCVKRRSKAIRNVNIVIEKMELIAEFMDLQETNREMLRKEDERRKKEIDIKARDEELEQKLRSLLPKAPEGKLNDESCHDNDESHIPPPTYDDFFLNENESYINLPSAPLDEVKSSGNKGDANESSPIVPPPIPLAPSLSASLIDWGLTDSDASAKAKIGVSKDFRKVRSTYINQFYSFKRNKRISTFTLGTYQGKYAGEFPEKDSTNGCTVIAAMIALNHLNLTWNRPIPNSTIESIIDIDAPPILRKVRAKLGLMGDALIVPSDVNDYLVEINLLRQEQFIGVCGGNIADEVHISTLLGMLQDGHCNIKDKSNVKSKVVATLFFHEHVVCLIKSYTQEGYLRYEIVDSLPRTMESSERASAVRIRCIDIECFEVALRWYASTKFSDANCDYIDRYPWDETNCEFDPRVFQAFVWGNTE